MGIFDKKVVRNKSVKVNISSEDDEAIKALQRELKEFDQNLEFNIEEKLYETLQSLIKSGQKELRKLQNESGGNVKKIISHSELTETKTKVI